MKAVGIKQYLPIDHEQSLLDVEIDKPAVKGRDLLIAVKAISVNPVDTKVRQSQPDATEDQPRILGWDAAGVVEEVGDDCTLFKPGDEVYYAGDITRPGTYSEYHAVDERIVGRKPSSLSFEEAAALPLTAITAWEALFDRMKISDAHKGQSILILGGAGGVGSIAIQLAKWAGLHVITTASRSETTEWVTALGADLVVNHRGDWVDELKTNGVEDVPFILCLHSTAKHWDNMLDLIAPEGTICSIVDTESPVSINPLKDKSVTFAWEFMFTRPKHRTDSMIKQHELLNEVARLTDSGTIRTTLQETVSPINADNVKKVHRQIESGTTIGKIVLSGF